MHSVTDNLRVEQIQPLLRPGLLFEELPVGERGAETVASARQAISAILRGDDDRLLAVVGPCSIHDVAAAEAYASKLKAAATQLANDLVIVMRVYFEKPR